MVFARGDISGYDEQIVGKLQQQPELQSNSQC